MSVTPANDEVARAIAAEHQRQASIMAALANTTPKAALLSDWQQLANAVHDGMGEYLLPVGSKVTVRMADQRPSVETVYDAPLVVAHHGTGHLVTGSSGRVAILQMDRCLPYDTEFSPRQAFLCAVSVIPAGTYNVTFAAKTGDRAAGTYQFTLTQDLPAGGQLTGFVNYSGNTVSAWASATATTATETCAVTAGSDGVNLGTFSAAGDYPVPEGGTPTVKTVGSLRFYGLNAVSRVAYGNNRWLHSPLRQFLNAYGSDWWIPKTVFDRPPSYVGHDGYLTGLPEEVVAAMQPIAQTTALNYVTDGGTSSEPQYDTTYDKVFLPSGKQHHIEATAYYGGAAGLEGEAWDYWVRVHGSQTPAKWGQTYQEYRQYDLASPTTARTCWVRSANRGNGLNVTFVYSSGTCNSSNANNALRAAPACAIGSIG